MENWALFNSVFNASTIESLREEERLLASLIFENAQEIVAQDSSVELYTDDDFGEKFDLTRKNLLDIIDAFNKAQNARKSFHEHYPNWSVCRENSISKLRELADCINADRFNCNIAKVTGSSVGIIGGAVLGASLIFPPAAVALAIGGGATALAGGATVFGTAVTEITLLKKKMVKAKVILETDQAEFKPMSKWFDRSKELIDLIDQIIGFSVIEEIAKDLKKFKGDVKSFMSLKQGTMHSMLKKFVQFFLYKAAPAYSGLVLQIPVIIAFIFVMILFRKNNSMLFDCVVLTHHTVFSLIKLFDLGSDLGMIVCNAAITGFSVTDIATKAVAKAVAQGTLAGIGVALDAINLVFASIDIHKGSVSENAVRLKAVADRLDNELKVVQAVSEALSSDKCVI